MIGVVQRARHKALVWATSSSGCMAFEHDVENKGEGHRKGTLV
ncbi:hypothetical protein USDA257_c39000 [Sinorhizobium fredii USDA 257]|uniref:Uncharacterized protein n=1 Tax=Sinorhizobium fredii (strain USDA 257) TaxID=1185652 RepID=I3X989_SINF2|nr:hypothetical protein USDA257_c39000 [Sinorhizobium fredii USDA 257]